MARYTYWRTPDGRLHKGVDDRHAPSAILRHIGENAVLNEDNSITWQGWTHDLHREAVLGAISIRTQDGDVLPESHIREVISQSINAIIKRSGGGVAIRPNELLNEADKAIGSYLRSPLESYTYYTSLSLEGLPFKRSTFRGATIRPSSPPKLDHDHLASRHAESGSPLHPHLHESKYKWIAVSLKARCNCTAIDSAQRAVDVLRGVWNWMLTYCNATRNFGIPARRAIGKVHEGAIQLLLDSDGKFIDRYWYDPQLPPLMPVFRQSPMGPSWLKLETQRREIYGFIRKCPYRRSLERIIAIYARAISDVDYDVAFLRLWGLLERVTNTTGSPYEKTIERALWYDPDRSMGRGYLRYLQIRRNAYVHSSASDGDPELLLATLKNYVDMHIGALLKNFHQLSSVEEYGELLDSPVDLTVLRRRHHILSEALKLRAADNDNC